MPLALHPRLKKAIAAKEADRIAAAKKLALQRQYARDQARAAKRQERAQQDAQDEATLEVMRKQAEETIEIIEDPLAGMDPELRDAMEEELERRRAEGSISDDVGCLCPKVYANPSYLNGERKYCLRDLFVKDGHTFTRCYQHGHEDPKFGAPLCKNGEVHPAHKPGVHPAVYPKEPQHGLCYFCIKAAEADYTDALLSGEEPSGMVVAGASIISESILAVADESVADEAVADEAVADEAVADEADEAVADDELVPVPPMSGEYLAIVTRATHDIGLTAEQLSFESVQSVYDDAIAAGTLTPQVLDACNFLHQYLSSV